MTKKKAGQELVGLFTKSGLKEFGQEGTSAATRKELQEAFIGVIGNGMKNVLEDSTDPAAKVLFNKIDDTVSAAIGGADMDAAIVRKTLLDMSTNTPKEFEQLLVKIAKESPNQFDQMVKTMDGATLQTLYKEAGEDTIGQSLQESLEQSVARGVKGSDFILRETGETLSQDTIRIMIGDDLVRRGIDPEDNVAVKNYLKDYLKIGFGAAPYLFGIYWLMNLTHGITGISYVDLMAALLNPSSLFDGDSGSNGDDDDGSPKIVSNLGLIMLALVGIVGITVVMRIIKGVTS